MHSMRVHVAFPFVGALFAILVAFTGCGDGATPDDGSDPGLDPGCTSCETVDFSATLLAANSYEEAGTAVTAVGDVNDDGYDDFAIGAPFAGEGGQVYGVFGPVEGEVTLDQADFVLTHRGENGHAGTCLASGDVNDDGVTDLLVGAPEAGTGKVYVLYGPVDTGRDMADADATINLSEAGGFCRIAAGDVTGDLNDDVVIGMPDSRLVYLATNPISGTIDATTQATVFKGPKYSDAGFAVAVIGDVNGDSTHDFAVGAPSLTGEVDDTKVYIVVGGTYTPGGDPRLLNDTSYARLVAGAYDYFGYSLAWSEATGLLVGAPGIYSEDKEDAGAVFRYSNIATGDHSVNEATSAIRGSAEFTMVGKTIAVFGSTIVVGTDRDEVYLFNQFRDGGLDKADIVLTGDSGSETGISLASAGDTNGDGKPDLLVGARSLGDGGGALVFNGR